MNKSIQQQLDGHGTAPHDLEIQLPNGQLRLKEASVEAVGVSTSGAEYTPNQQWDVRGAAGQSLAGKIKDRVTYLLEPLEVIETEAESVLIRSRQPHQVEGQRSYYEGWAKPAGFDLKRYAAAPKEARKPAPLRLTRDIVERLASDLDSISTD
ncbi:hypothetical protein [Blastopirellula marina]|uniref:Uncharacterized protein n=1 Tax=Blastopirellula marina DSM 3645 TaxID=314230 RepID=A4A004_9BACT|nr:hypothetical protein [Blastopirellula marina]EAQ77951.1 hypothetical protein DSM3645_27271 [Blastopirellula marina DSM 3645]